MLNHRTHLIQYLYDELVEAIPGGLLSITAGVRNSKLLLLIYYNILDSLFIFPLIIVHN
jgi:hypothetical protein